MLSKNYVKFFIVFFILETSLPQNIALDFITEANFNYTVAYYQVVFVAFLSDNSSTFWTAYSLISDDVQERFYRNVYSAIREVKCPKEESICKRYNIENDSILKVFISGEEYDTLVGPITSESLLNFIDEYLSDEIHVGSGGGICSDLEENEEEEKEEEKKEEEEKEEEDEQVEVDRLFPINLPQDVDSFGINSTDIFNEHYVSTTDSSGEISEIEEPAVRSTSYETLGRNSNAEFSFEDTEEIDSIPEEIDSIPEEIDSIPEETDSIPEEIDSIPEKIDSVPEETNSDVENSTESNTSFSKANAMKRTADFVVLFSLLYYLYS